MVECPACSGQLSDAASCTQCGEHVGRPVPKKGFMGWLQACLIGLEQAIVASGKAIVASGKAVFWLLGLLLFVFFVLVIMFGRAGGFRKIGPLIGD